MSSMYDPTWEPPVKRDPGLRRVWVVQNQHRWDRDGHVFVPKYDVSPAKDFGTLFDLLSPTAAPFNPDPIIAELTKKLRDFCDEDSLLAIGNPVLIGWATSIAAGYNGGRVRSLQWSGRDQRYIAVEASGLFTFPA